MTIRRRPGRPYRGDWYEPDEGSRGSQLEEDLAALEDGLKPYGIDLNDEARDNILLFSEELLDWNDRLNLLSRADAPNVIRKHVAASLGIFLVAPPSPAERWIDVGTGAGFPGLVLKIARPELRMHLLDSARKRCLFLENTIRMMGIRDVEVIPRRVETLVAQGERIGHYEIMTARAVAALPETLVSFGHLVGVGGRILTFKGPNWAEEVDNAVSKGAMDSSGFQFESATRIPWTAGHILSLRKIKPGRPRM